MFARVLFPTDLTSYAHALLDCLSELKAAGLRQVVLLNVIRESEVPLAHTPINAESLARVQWSREESLHVVRMALEGQGLSVRTRVEYGAPAREIVRVAQEERADLIVMGAQGEGAIQEFLLGGTTFNVLRLSPVPVLIQKFDVVRELGHTECRRVCHRIFARVLHPTDFSDCANAAFNVVKRLKAAGTEQVLLLHVEDERVLRDQPAENLAASVHDNMESLERMRRDLVLCGLPAKVVLRHGVPFREALKVADEEDASVIVLGLRGRSAWQEMIAGGTFEKIVRESQRPVLVVPRQVVGHF